MSSIIEGYNYDIFISYRQKDNKGDRWVSEFVEALKTELESTFKEEISVYFDINPHDGLLETHDVDASLKDKLNCLVFIPIISRTYCDPKSFAWEHEFKAFVGQASQDKYGLKVKLPNGNVANRILPIQIHEITAVDKTNIEKELGGILRAIEFIYKEPGVNKPLTSNDDEKLNLNKTKYRIQINKVANAIDEIIHSLKGVQPEMVKEKIQQTELLRKPKQVEERRELERPIKLKRWKILTGFIVTVVVLLITVMFIFPKVFKKNTIEKLRSSGERITVAVMPFQNITIDTTLNVWQIGIQDALINALSNSEELMVRQPESINNLLERKGFANYASITPSVASTVSQKLDASVFIHGSIKQVGIIIRLNAQLIDSKTKNVFKSFQSEGNADKIMALIDTLSLKLKDYLVISKLNKETAPLFRAFNSTNSPDAYRDFQEGLKAMAKQDYPTARERFFKSFGIDSNFVDLIFLISLSYINQGLIEEGRKWCIKAYNKRDIMSVKMKIRTNWLYSGCFETPYEAIKYLKQLQEIDNQDGFFDLGNQYNWLEQYDKAIPEYEKAIEINKKQEQKGWPPNYTQLGFTYHKTHQYRKEKKLYKEAEKIFPDDPNLIYRQVILSLAEGDDQDASRYIEKYRFIRKENSWSEADISTSLAEIYSEAGIPDQAEKYYREALKSSESESDNSWYLNNLAYFLIDEERNINEGMELIDKALKSVPDDNYYLHTKGLGLYKKGMYKESLENLEKSWTLRTWWNQDLFNHLEATKKAVANQK